MAWLVAPRCCRRPIPNHARRMSWHWPTTRAGRNSAYDSGLAAIAGPFRRHPARRDPDRPTVIRPKSDGPVTADPVDAVPAALAAPAGAVVREVPADAVVDLAQVQQALVNRGQLAGYEVKRRFYEIGSVAGLQELDRLLTSGRA